MRNKNQEKEVRRLCSGEADGLSKSAEIGRAVRPCDEKWIKKYGQILPFFYGKTIDRFCKNMYSILRMGEYCTNRVSMQIFLGREERKLSRC